MIRIRAFSPKNQAVTRNSASLSERGGVIIIILIAIALFAALSFVFSKGNRNSASQIDDQKATLYATEILNHFRAVKNVTDELQISNGCTPIELNVWFDWNDTGTLQESGNDRNNNIFAPTRADCSIHLPEGGNLPRIEKPDFLEPSEMHRNYLMTGDWSIEGLGTLGGEVNYTLTLLGSDKALATCNAFNRLVGLEEDLVDSLNVSSMPYFFRYEDDNTGVTAAIIGDAAPDLVGQRVGCFVSYFTSARYIFYQVLGVT